MPTAVSERRTRSRLIGRRQYSGRSLATSSHSVLQRGRRVAALGVSWEAAVVAICLPPIFLHSRWQPGITVHVGQTDLAAYLSDFAVARGCSRRRRDRDQARLRASQERTLDLGGGRRIPRLDARRGRIRSPPLGRLPVADARGDRGEVRRVRAARAGSPARPAAAGGRSRASLDACRCGAASPRSSAWRSSLGASIFVFGRIGGRQGSFLSEADFAALSGAVLLVGILALLMPELGLGSGTGLHGPCLRSASVRSSPRQSRHCSGWRRQASCSRRSCCAGGS